MREFDRDRTTMFFDPLGEPIAEVDPGERILVRTADSLCGLAKRTAPRGYHIDDVLDELGGACPLTGPFYVTGAQPGDLLVLELHQVAPDPSAGEAWTGVFDGFGALTSEVYSLQPSIGRETRVVPYRDGVAQFPAKGGSIPIPMKPFLGTVGVAPKRERRMTFSQAAEYLGDVDLPQLRAGASVVLPVNVPGALFSLGDAHAAQGDGEITGTALEIEAEVQLTVRVVPGDGADFAGLPQLNTEKSIGSIASLYGVHLGDCARAAYVDLVRRLVKSHGFSQLEAYELVGQVGRLRIGNMIDPFYSALATIDRRYL